MMLNKSFDSKQAIENNSIKKNPSKNDNFMYLLVTLSCIGGFLFGYDTGIISGALLILADDFNLSDVQEELVVTITIIGAMISSFSAGPLSDHYGRKPIVLTSAVIFIAGAIVMAASTSYSVLVAGRFIVGLGVGSASMIVPVIISETAEREIRGFLVSCIQVAITFGQLVSCIVAGSFSYVSGGWRYMFGLAAIPAIIQFFGFFYMPESPRWLVQNKQIEAARQVLVEIRGKEESLVEDELKEIIDSIRIEQELTATHTDNENSKNSWKNEWNVLKQQLSQPEIYRALLFGCSLQAAQQLGGINTVMYYGATILSFAGFTDVSEAIWLSTVLAFFNFLGAVLALRLIERIGRRSLALSSQFAVTLMLGVLSLCFYLASVTSPDAHNSSLYDSPYVEDNSGGCSGYKYCFDCVQDDGCGYCSDTSLGSGASACVASSNDDDQLPSNSTLCTESNYYPDSCPGSTVVGWMLFMFFCLYLLAFSIGMGPIPWCVNSEIYPMSFRGKGNSLSTAVNWTCNIIISMTFLSLIAVTSRQGAFAIYCGISVLFLMVFYKYFPETKGLSLESISLFFDDKHWGKIHYIVEEQDNCVEVEMAENDGVVKNILLEGKDN